MTTNITTLRCHDCDRNYPADTMAPVGHDGDQEFFICRGCADHNGHQIAEEAASQADGEAKAPCGLCGEPHDTICDLCSTPVCYGCMSGDVCLDCCDDWDD